MEHYEKKGYLSSDFRLFHLTDRSNYDRNHSDTV